MPLGPNSPDLISPSLKLQKIREELITQIDAQMQIDGIVKGVFTYDINQDLLTSLSSKERLHLIELLKEAYLSADVGWTQIWFSTRTMWFNSEDAAFQERKASQK